MLEKVRRWLAKLALRYALYEHRRWCENNRLGTQLNFTGQRLDAAVFNNAELRFGDFGAARLCGANFRHADLSMAALNNAHVRNCDITGTDFTGTIKNLENKGKLLNSMYVVAEANGQIRTHIAEEQPPKGA